MYTHTVAAAQEPNYPRLGRDLAGIRSAAVVSGFWDVVDL